MGRRQLGGVLLLAACLLVACSDGDASDAVGDAEGSGGAGRDATPSDGAPVLTAPAIGDHWHLAYGIYVCDGYLAPLADQGPDAQGIHTHQDGLIHVHPFTEEATGEAAVLGLFLDQVGVSLDDDSLVLPDGRRYASGDDCIEGPADVRVLRWDGPEDRSPQVVEEGLTGVGLDVDGGVLAIVVAPAGIDIPPPPSAADVSTPSDVVP